jgi:hypothetical protein
MSAWSGRLRVSAGANSASIDREECGMAACEVCGNDYDMAFEVHAQGAVHVFDSFECAIHRMAPVCEHCGCRIIGHGVQLGGRFFCCAHCASSAEDRGAALADRA